MSVEPVSGSKQHLYVFAFFLFSQLILVETVDACPDVSETKTKALEESTGLGCSLIFAVWESLSSDVVESVIQSGRGRV